MKLYKITIGDEDPNYYIDSSIQSVIKSNYINSDAKITIEVIACTINWEIVREEINECPLEDIYPKDRLKRWAKENGFIKKGSKKDLNELEKDCGDWATKHLNGE